MSGGIRNCAVRVRWKNRHNQTTWIYSAALTFKEAETLAEAVAKASPHLCSEVSLTPEAITARRIYERINVRAARRKIASTRS